jgi:hypothetical protein
MILVERDDAPGVAEGAHGCSSETKMALTIEATKAIFDLVDDDEVLGIIAFATEVQVVSL